MLSSLNKLTSGFLCSMSPQSPPEAKKTPGTFLKRNPSQTGRYHPYAEKIILVNSASNRETTVVECSPAINKPPEAPGQVPVAYSHKKATDFFNLKQDWKQLYLELNDWMQCTTIQQRVMPCMQETQQVIRDQLQSFIEKDWLSAEDKAALQDYLDKVNDLTNRNYPYIESLEVGMLFPLVQAMFYVLSYEHEPGWSSDIKKCNLLKIKTKWEEKGYGRFGLKTLIEKPWHLLYRNNLSGDAEEDRLKLLHFCANIAYVTNSQSTNILDGLRILAENKKLCIVTFSDANLEVLNKCHHLPVVYIQLSEVITARHDNKNMSCVYLPYHDLLHAIDHYGYSFYGRIPTQTELQNLEQEKITAEHGHDLVCAFYSHPHSEKAIQCAAELTLFHRLHEMGEKNIGNLSLNAFIYAARDAWRGSAIYADLPDDYMHVLKEGGHTLATAVLWLYSLMQSRPCATSGSSETSAVMSPDTLLFKQWSQRFNKEIGDRTIDSGMALRLLQDAFCPQ